MNTTLEFVCSDREFGTPGSRPFLGTTRWDENYRAEVQALGSGNRIAGDAVELIDKSAAESRDRSKSMHLATAVLDESRASNIHFHCDWLVSPGVRVLSVFQFFDELIKCRVPVADARAVAQYRIESSRVTIVEQPNLLITLNGAGAGGQAQQTDGSECRPYHGSKIQPSVHRIKPPFPKPARWAWGETGEKSFSGLARLR